MNRDTAVRTWRDVCGSDAVMAMGVVTGRMLEEFARRIEAAERERLAKLCTERAQLAWAAADQPYAAEVKMQHEAVAAAMEELAGDMRA